MGNIFGIAKRGFGMLKKARKKGLNLTKKNIFGTGKEWDILKKNPHLAKQKYSDSSVNKYLTKEFKKKK